MIGGTSQEPTHADACYLPAYQDRQSLHLDERRSCRYSCPDFDAAVSWYTEKLDFRVMHTWPYGDLKLAYVAPAVDDTFRIELLAGPGA
jgi:hypothetical protein